MDGFGRSSGSAHLIPPDPFTLAHRGAIIRAAEERRIPGATQGPNCDASAEPRGTERYFLR